MPQCLTSFLCLLILFSQNFQGTSFAQAPPPLAGMEFQLPLSDQTMAEAVYLPTADGQACIVYATKTGSLGFLTITNQPNPDPTPTPPPEPPKPVIVSIITVTETEPAKLPADVLAAVEKRKGRFHAFTIAMVADDDPPPNALQWIGRTAGKRTPWTFLAGNDGSILWQGPTPTTSAAFLELLAKPPTPTLAPSACQDGTCPTTRSRRR